MVFFRNLSVYRLPPGWSVSVAQLQEMLARRLRAHHRPAGGIHGLGARA